MTELVHVSVRFPIALHEYIVAFKDRREEAAPNLPYPGISLNDTMLKLVEATLSDPDKLAAILAIDAQ